MFTVLRKNISWNDGILRFSRKQICVRKRVDRVLLGSSVEWEIFSQAIEARIFESFVHALQRERVHFEYFSFSRVENYVIEFLPLIEQIDSRRRMGHQDWLKKG